MLDYIYNLVPKNKFDTSNIDMLKTISIKEATPILDELLGCLQDINWPIAKELIIVLPRFHFELVPHIKGILNSEDDIWKCWVLCLVQKFPKETVILLSEDIKRIANTPSPEGPDEYARDVVEQFDL